MNRLSLDEIRAALLYELELDDDWRTPTVLARAIGFNGGGYWYEIALVLERLANDGTAEIHVSGNRRYFRRAGG